MDSGGAGLSMTVDDYMKFAYAMTNGGVGMNGNRILTNTAIELMRTDALSEEQYKDIFESARGRRGYSYGLGVRVHVDPTESGRLTPVGEFGWGSAWGTYTQFDPENRVALVYGQQGVTNELRLRTMNALYAALEWEGLIGK